MEEASASTSSAESPREGDGLPGWRLVCVGLLCLTAAAISGLLLLQHHGEPLATASVQALCGPASGCDRVLKSPYARIGGVPWAAVGLLFYLSLALLPLLALLTDTETRSLAGAFLLVALGAAVFVDIGLLSIQIGAIKDYCRFCLSTYVLNVLAVVAVLPVIGKVPALGRALQDRQGRLLLAGWLTSGASLAGGLWAAEVGLTSRERERESRMLGGPVAALASPVTTPHPVRPIDAGPPDLKTSQEEARAAREEARRLQEILDDPRKLQQYLDEKAARDFEQAPVQSLKLDAVPFNGPVQAPIRVVEFSDFLCPYCRGIAGAFANYIPKSAGRVVVYFKNYPLDQECNANIKPSVHPGACWVALGGLCAQDQGRFWPYHDKVFSTPLNKPEAKDVVKLATEVGLDGSRLDKCMRDPRTKARLSAEIAEGHGAGVEGTPTLYINGRRLPRINDFIQAVDKEAARLGLPRANPPAS
jgi:protein-disulfide isomerase/uncharacterized membrane protein